MYLKTVIFFLLGVVCLALSSFTSDNPATSYIDQYKDLAIIEMHRSGIPASIILAQGLLESGNGNSDLAIGANNHFGIKCKTYWRGSMYFHEDDDYDKRGNLTKSCFRAYENPIDSYVDHSNFLMYTERYEVLFNYSNTDYIQWAHGLKSCGYATDKAYATKLITKIEQFQLFQYDNYPHPMRVKLN